jgi:hypothetical protein
MSESRDSLPEVRDDPHELARLAASPSGQSHWRAVARSRTATGQQAPGRDLPAKEEFGQRWTYRREGWSRQFFTHWRERRKILTACLPKK